MSVRALKAAITLSVLSVLTVLAAGCGGDSKAVEQGVVFTAVAPMKALAVPGTACTMGIYANAGHRVTTDALGTVYLASVCGGQGYVAVSRDGAKTFEGPTGIGLANLSRMAVKGGPGVAYAFGLTAAGEAYFTRTQDHGVSWDAPVLLATGLVSTGACAGLATRGDQVFVELYTGVAPKVYRNASRGTGAFSASTLPVAGPVFCALHFDSSGKLWSGHDDPALSLSSSADGGVTFGAWGAVSGASMMYSSWGLGADVIWVVGASNSAYRIPVATPTVATAVTGIVAAAGSGETVVAADDAGTAYVATVTATGVQVQRALLADAAFGASTIVDAAGRYPGVAAPPGTGKVIVAFEKAGEIWTMVHTY